MLKNRSVKNCVLLLLLIVIWISSCNFLANKPVVAQEYHLVMENSQTRLSKRNAPPTVNITYPEEGETIEILVDSTINVTWTASDPDNDTLLFSVAYGKTGTDWLFLDQNITQSWHNFYARNITKGTVKIRVTATDGLNVVEDIVTFAIVKLELIPGFEVGSIVFGISSLIIIETYRRKNRKC
ncbi:MAG: hypothetical protein ACFFBD_12350 [Candidatus Hodarchaeota archaeon]